MEDLLTHPYVIATVALSCGRRNIISIWLDYKQKTQRDIQREPLFRDQTLNNG